MVKLKVARIVERAVAPLALGTVLCEQELVHLCPAHLFAFRFLDPFPDLQERYGFGAFVGSNGSLFDINGITRPSGGASRNTTLPVSAE